MPNGHLRRASIPNLQHAPLTINPRRSRGVHLKTTNPEPPGSYYRTSVWRGEHTTDTQWVLGIPDKARTLYFSQDDLGATDNRIARSSTRNPGFLGRTSSPPQTRSRSSAALRSPSSPPYTRVVPRISPRSRSSCRLTSMADSETPETFLDESNGPDRDDKRRSRSRRPSIRKTLSLITDSRRTSIDMPTSPLSPTFPPKRKSFNFSKRTSIPAVEYPESEPQRPSQYYQDPEARMKLKMVLASPQNFDQALEHGFPSTKVLDPFHAIPQPPSLPKMQPAPKQKTLPKTDPQPPFVERSFFDDSDDDDNEDADEDDDDQAESRNDANNNNIKQNVTLQEDAARGRRSFDDADGYGNGDHDEWSATDDDSPITPPNQTHSAVDDSTNQRRPGKPKPVASPLQTWDESTWSGNREMTLRMTLTKPELRATDEQLYGWQRTQQPARADPLALEALPPMRDHSALRRGSRSNQEAGKVRGLWRKVRPGSRG